MNLYFNFNRFLLIFVFAISFHLVCHPQIKNNPRKYFENINKAELAICDSNYIEAVKNYKIAFHYLKEPFGEDLNNFLWSGLITNDKEAINICIPFYKERNYKIPKGGLGEIYKYMDSLSEYSTVITKIDTNYRHFVEEISRKDQTMRREIDKNLPFEKVDSITNLIDIANMALFKQFVDSTGIFPTEAIVGNDGVFANGKLIYETLFIHYCSTVGIKGYSQNPANFQLDKKVQKGEFSPDLYAHLCDSRKYGLDGKIRTKAEYFSQATVFSKRDSISGERKYEIKFHDFTAKGLKKLNATRKKMNMEPYEDIKKKISYQVKIRGTGEPFQLVNSWLFLIIST